MFGRTSRFGMAAGLLDDWSSPTRGLDLSLDECLLGRTRFSHPNRALSRQPRPGHDVGADPLADLEFSQARCVTSHAIGLDATTTEVIVVARALTKKLAGATTEAARPSTS